MASRRLKIRIIEPLRASERRRTRIIEHHYAPTRRNIRLVAIANVSERHNTRILVLPCVSPGWDITNINAKHRRPCLHPTPFPLNRWKSAEFKISSPQTCTSFNPEVFMFPILQDLILECPSPQIFKPSSPQVFKSSKKGAGGRGVAIQ